MLKFKQTGVKTWDCISKFELITADIWFIAGKFVGHIRPKFSTQILFQTQPCESLESAKKELQKLIVEKTRGGFGNGKINKFVYQKSADGIFEENL